MEYLENNFIAA